MIANFSWKSAKSASGIVGARSGSVAPSTPRRKRNVSGLPISPVPRPPMLSPKARLKPTTTQSTLTTPMAMKLCTMVEITLLPRTIPP